MFSVSTATRTQVDSISDEEIYQIVEYIEELGYEYKDYSSQNNYVLI